LKDIRLRFISDLPHLLSDGAVHTISADENVAGVLRSVSGCYSDTVFPVFHTLDTFACQHSIFVLETIEKEVQHDFTVDESLRVSKSMRESAPPRTCRISLAPVLKFL